MTLAGSNSLAVMICGAGPDGGRRTLDPGPEGLIPSSSTNHFIHPADSCKLPAGLASGRSQRQGCYTHCHFGSSARRKQGQNDVPFVPDRM